MQAAVVIAQQRLRALCSSKHAAVYTKPAHSTVGGVAEDRLRAAAGSRAAAVHSRHVASSDVHRALLG
jgi:hypothetical protein